MERYSESMKKNVKLEEMNVYHLINALRFELNKVTLAEAVKDSEMIAEMFEIISKKIKQERGK